MVPGRGPRPRCCHLCCPISCGGGQGLGRQAALLRPLRCQSSGWAGLLAGSGDSESPPLTQRCDFRRWLAKGRQGSCPSPRVSSPVARPQRAVDFLLLAAPGLCAPSTVTSLWWEWGVLGDLAMDAGDDPGRRQAWSWQAGQRGMGSRCCVCLGPVLGAELRARSLPGVGSLLPRDAGLIFNNGRYKEQVPVS